MSRGYSTKIYIVQRATGEVIAAKTAFLPAHSLAKENAPAKVLFARADKGTALNVSDHESDDPCCK